MFSKSEKSSSGPNSVREARAAPSIISASLHVVGNLQSQGEVQVDGTVEGDVSGKSIAVGERAKVTGEISAEEVVVHGVVEGKIRAKRVQLAKSAKVIGDIWHEILSIESGAHLEGHIKRFDHEKKGGEKKINLVTEPEKPTAVEKNEPATLISQTGSGR